MEEPLENVEVFSVHLSAIDFIEEHEEDEGDEDILFMLFPGNLRRGIALVPDKRTLTLTGLARRECVLHSFTVLIVVQHSS